MTVRFLDVCSDVFQALAFVHHFHHVTRDAYADFSADAHRVEFRLLWRRIILDVAGSIARVAVVHTAAIARNVAERFSIEDGEAVSVPDFRRSIPKALWKHRHRRQFVNVVCCAKRVSGRQGKRSS